MSKYPQTKSARSVRSFFGPLLCLRAPRLLVVEDDADLATYVTRIARSIVPDLVVDQVPRAVEARALIGVRDYTLVLADYQLEGRASGLSLKTFCESHGSRPRFALTSAYAVPPSAPEEARSFPFLPKPFSRGQCRDFLQQLLA